MRRRADLSSAQAESSVEYRMSNDARIHMTLGIAERPQAQQRRRAAQPVRKGGWGRSAGRSTGCDARSRSLPRMVRRRGCWVKVHDSDMNGLAGSFLPHHGQKKIMPRTPPIIQQGSSPRKRLNVILYLLRAAVSSKAANIQIQQYRLIRLCRAKTSAGTIRSSQSLHFWHLRTCLMALVSNLTSRSAPPKSSEKNFRAISDSFL